MAIIDDHLVTAEELGRILSEEDDLELAGIATTISDGLLLIERQSPTVVLMDYRLPDGNGGAATESILERWPDTKILMLSRSDEPEALSRAFEAGCVGFLGKNRPREEILTAVRAAAQGHSVIRADELSALIIRLKATTEKAQVLTSRELNVLRLVAKGRTTNDIAAELWLSIHTVRNHVASILMKLGAHSKLEAVAISLRDNIISLEEFS